MKTKLISAAMLACAAWTSPAINSQKSSSFTIEDFQTARLPSEANDQDASKFRTSICSPGPSHLCTVVQVVGPPTDQKVQLVYDVHQAYGNKRILLDSARNSVRTTVNIITAHDGKKQWYTNLLEVAMVKPEISLDNIGKLVMEAGDTGDHSKVAQCLERARELEIASMALMIKKDSSEFKAAGERFKQKPADAETGLQLGSLLMGDEVMVDGYVTMGEYHKKFTPFFASPRTADPQTELTLEFTVPSSLTGDLTGEGKIVFNVVPDQREESGIKLVASATTAV